MSQICISLICASVALIFPLYWVSPQGAVLAVKHLGFWAMLTTLLLFLLALRTQCKHITFSDIRHSAHEHLPALLLILTATLYLHLQIDRGFKILFDEYALSSTAMSFYFDERAFVQAASHRLDGNVIASAGFVDKRPLFFPFIVSLCHKFTGFRAENVFWLNSGLTCLLLGLLYSIVTQTCGKRHGILAVLILTSLPLLAQNTTGGGYEIMNLCLISILALSSAQYMRAPGSQGLNLVILSAILLANNRYESLLYVLVPVLLCGLKSLRTQQIRLTWFAAFSPLLVLPAVFSFAIFQSDARFLQTTGDNFFNLTHLPSNLTHAASYLFEIGGAYSNSFLLSAAGCMALPFIAIQLIRRFRYFLNEDTALSALLIIALVVLTTTTLALTCFWGQWTDPMTSRFSLPLQYFLVLAVPFALHEHFKLKQPPYYILVACAVFILSVSSAHSARIRINREARMPVAAGSHWAMHWICNNIPTAKTLIIADACIGLQLYGYSALPISVANQMPERVRHVQALELYNELYLVEALQHKDTRTIATVSNSTPINPRFTLQTVAQTDLGNHLFYQISRITGLNPAPAGKETLPANLPPAPHSYSQSPEDYIYDSLPLLPHQ